MVPLPATLPLYASDAPSLHPLQSLFYRYCMQIKSEPHYQPPAELEGAKRDAWFCTIFEIWETSGNAIVDELTERDGNSCKEKFSLVTMIGSVYSTHLARNRISSFCLHLNLFLSSSAGLITASGRLGEDGNSDSGYKCWLNKSCRNPRLARVLLWLKYFPSPSTSCAFFSSESGPGASTFIRQSLGPEKALGSCVPVVRLQLIDAGSSSGPKSLNTNASLRNMYPHRNIGGRQPQLEHYKYFTIFLRLSSSHSQLQTFINFHILQLRHLNTYSYHTNLNKHLAPRPSVQSIPNLHHSTFNT
ncbi:uncharacterized protein BDR25DRAFT_395227 [Lindgomyces ingoldianus]|uniref:Uncharacterized protein n=1 Tax=Lindgomyces ingoldianus TaxID=673940 RepID=A0ACB6QKM5_9PLEO|nr:uncharacterized protein BDR25DRAFT_395227 [Lindgomyces ingoldianus]KAF2467417.1 hypothetical protein BDR25DRAFT_395227 [Lindgomyces ingoldianus]